MKLKWLRSQHNVCMLVVCAEPTASDPLAQRDTYTSWRAQFLAVDRCWAAHSLSIANSFTRFSTEAEAKAFAESSYILEEANDE